MNEPIVLHLRSTDEARQAFRRGALRYAAGKCAEWGHLLAADDLERYASFIGTPDQETTDVDAVVIDVDVPDSLDHFDDLDATKPGRPFRTTALNAIFDRICTP